MRLGPGTIRLKAEDDQQPGKPSNFFIVCAILANVSIVMIRSFRSKQTWKKAPLEKLLGNTLRVATTIFTDTAIREGGIIAGGGLWTQITKPNQPRSTNASNIL